MKRLLIFLLLLATSQMSYSIKPGSYGCLGDIIENPILKGLKLLARFGNTNSENSRQGPNCSLHTDNFQILDNSRPRRSLRRIQIVN